MIFKRIHKDTGRIVEIGEAKLNTPFVWFFHEGKYWIRQKELYEFIREGIIKDANGNTWNSNEFIAFAEVWGKFYETKDMKKDYIDGLRVAK